jgi:hypothetical protein
MPRFSSRPSARELLARLVAELEQHGVRVLDARAFPTAGVLRASPGLTVWCYGHLLRWRHNGEEIIWPAADAYGAARRLAELAQKAAPNGTGTDVSGRHRTAGDDRLPSHD